jgi:tetratricopeptide (TPR) repeat protein
MLATKPQAMARNYLPPPQNHPAPAAPAPVVRSQSPRQPRPAQWVASVPPRTIAPANPPAVPPTTPEPAAKPGFWDRLKPTSWFAPSPADKKYENNGVTPLPTTGDSQAAADSAGPVAMDTFPRYSYQSPARPHAGDRPAAAGSFTSARVSEQASRFVDAMQQYHSAAEFDPSWFDAQYDYAVLCQRLGDYRQSLGAYEMALAIQPDSVDARYNFALALKAAGYVPDAVNELKRLLAAHPDEVRGHMALASLYAKKLHDTVRAREHYLKALDLDPGNPQAAGIRNWLSANPG